MDNIILNKINYVVCTLLKHSEMPDKMADRLSPYSGREGIEIVTTYGFWGLDLLLIHGHVNPNWAGLLNVA